MAYYPTYPKLFREKTSPRVYEMTPEGYYNPIQDEAEFYKKGYRFEDVKTAPSFGAMYGQQAEQMYAPTFQAQEATTKSYYQTMQEQLESRLKDEYSRRGILSSGLYGQEASRSQTKLAEQQAAALSNLQAQKQQAISGDVRQQMQSALTGQGQYLQTQRQQQQMEAQRQQMEQSKKQQQWENIYRLLELELGG